MMRVLRTMMRVLRAMLPAAVALATGATAVRADCYDILGCSDRSRFSRHADYLDSRTDGPTCEFLSTMRNRIYQEHGFCFATPKLREELGNDGCSVHDVGALALSPIESANVAAIARAERIKHCSRPGM